MVASGNLVGKKAPDFSADAVYDQACKPMVTGACFRL